MEIIRDFISLSFRQVCIAIASKANHWAPGRQGTGYEKLDLKTCKPVEPIVRSAMWILGVTADYGFWDAYLLRYPDMAFIPKHRDEAGMFGMEHYRINALVKPATLGGLLIMEGATIMIEPGDAIVFRPDVEEHEVTQCRDERLVLSVGCWKKKED
jgi:hypothetical protein